MTHLSFLMRVFVYAFWRRLSHAARRASFYATAALLAFLPFRFFGFHPSWLPESGWACAVVYSSGALLGLVAAFVWRESEILPDMGYWQHLRVVVAMLPDDARKKHVREFRRQVLFWNPVLWPARATVKIYEFIQIFRKKTSFTPTVWSHPRRTLWGWMWDRVRARFA